MEALQYKPLQVLRQEQDMQVGGKKRFGRDVSDDSKERQAGRARRALRAKGGHHGRSARGLDLRRTCAVAIFETATCTNVRLIA